MKILVVCAIAALFSVSAAGAPLCTTVLGLDVTTLNAGGGCEHGAYLFDSFAVQDAALNGGGPILLVGVVSNPAIELYTLVFNAQLGNPTLTQDLHFVMRVTTLGGGIGIYAAGLSAVGSGAGSHVQENICDSAGVNINNGLCNAPPQLFGAVAFANQTIPLTAIDPQSVVWVWKDINSDPGGSLTTFTQSFQAIPEPTVSVLIGAGLLGLSLLRKRMQ